MLALRRRASDERRLTQGFALTLALLLAVLSFCLWQASHFLASDWRVAHTKEVTRDMNDTLTQVLTAESSQRGFSATDQDGFLAPFQYAVDGIPKRLAALRAGQ